MKKKIFLSLAILGLTSHLLCACGKETPLLSVSDYELDNETSATARGVKVGDSYETFLSAYEDFGIFAATAEDSKDSSPEETPDALSELSEETSTEDNSANTGNALIPSYEFQALNEVSADQLLITIIPTFFIDGQPIDPQQFCEDNEIETADLIPYLTADSFLAGHRVVYRYLLFTWEGGAITDIRTESMDYNQDGSYYEAN